MAVAMGTPSLTANAAACHAFTPLSQEQNERDANSSQSEFFRLLPVDSSKKVLET
jgi:hypothetical protein